MPNSFEVFGSTDIFKRQRFTFTLEAGCTLDDALVALVDRSGCAPAQLRNASVVIDDRLIPKPMWSSTRPKAGARVLICALPGKKFGSIFVQLAALVAANFLFPGSGFAMVAARAAVTVAGSLVAAAIAPSPKQRLSQGTGPAPDARYSITGVANRVAPYEPIPVIYGRVTNYYPPLGAIPYTEILSGDEQYLRMVFVVGQAGAGAGGADSDYQISDIKIGTTPIASFIDATVEIRTGAASESAITIFPAQVREEALNIQLRKVDGYSQRTTPIDTDQISLDVSFPNGVIRISNRGTKFNIRVQFRVQYRLVGSSTWVNAPLSATYSVGAIIDGSGLFSIDAMSKSAVRRTVGFSVTRGQYEVRIQRVTVDDQGPLFDDDEFQSITAEDSYWTVLRSFKNDSPISRDRLALIAIRIRATDQLNGVIDQLSCTVERRLPVWNGSTWVTQATRNPAWAYADVLCGAANERALSANRLDKAALLAWANNCTTAGWQFDGVIDFESTVWQMMQDVAATGRASPDVLDGLYTVVEDVLKTTPVQKLTPHNTRNWETTRTYAEQPHGLRVRYPSESNGGQVTERVVYADGYNESNATRFEALDLPYTRDDDAAWKYARMALAAAQLRPDIHTCEMDWEHIAATRGDLVTATEDVILAGLGSARIKSVTLDGSSNATAIVIDTPQVMDGVTSYGVEIRRTADNTQITRQVNSVSGEQGTLAFTVPIPAASPQPAAGDLLSFGEYGSVSVQMIVRSITPRSDSSAELSLVDAAPAIHSAASGPIPAYEPPITLPAIVNRATPAAPVITSIQSDEDALLVSNNGLLQAQILLGIVATPNGSVVPADTVHVRYRLADTGNAWILLPPYGADATIISVTPVEEGRTYDLEVRTVSRYGLTSVWVPRRHTVVGQSTPPPDIDRMFREGDYLYWSYPDPPPDFAGFRVRANYGVNTNWASSYALHSGLRSDSRFDISGLTGTVTVMVKPVDLAGNEAVNQVIVTLNLGDPLTSNLLLTQSEDPTFTGVIVGGSVVSSELVADLEVDPIFWGPDTALFWPASGAATFWAAQTYAQLVYTATYAPDPDHVGATIRLKTDITGNVAIDYREINSPLFWGSNGSTFWGADSALFWAESLVTNWVPWPGQLGPLATDDSSYEFRVTVDAGTVQGTITDLDILVDVPDIIEYFEDVAVAATGTVRVVPTKPFRVIKIVNSSVQDDGGNALSVRVLDKNATLGPSVQTLDESKVRAAGTVDFTFIGY